MAATKTTAKKPAARKPAAKKPAARKPTVRKAKPVACGKECRGTDGHKTTGCELEKGHGGMHWHPGRNKQHVYTAY